MDSVKDMLLLLISSSIVSNIVLSQFMGLCPFLGVSRKIKTAGGMGTAVIFVITLASAVAGVIYKFILQPLHIEYLETIVFILVIAALVQFVEMFLKKAMPSLYQALGVYLPLITTNCAVLGSAVQMAAFGYCLYLLWSGKILYGTMTLFLSQGTKLSSAFNALVRTVPSFLSASVSARRIRDLFALEPEPVLPVSVPVRMPEEPELPELLHHYDPEICKLLIFLLQLRISFH